VIARKPQKRRLPPLHRGLCSAIKSKRLVAFNYQGLPRIAEPHDYGRMNGVEQLLVYQIEGESRSQKLPDWRLIRVAEIKELTILDRSFSGGRPVPSNKHKKWDKLFIRVSPAA
jgi:hypothetical protein